MPEYNVAVSFSGVGSLKVRAGSEAEAREDAVQMDVDDIEWDSHNMKVLSVEEDDAE